jgi:hypothetical protein
MSNLNDKDVEFIARPDLSQTSDSNALLNISPHHVGSCWRSSRYEPYWSASVVSEP